MPNANPKSTPPAPAEPAAPEVKSARTLGKYEIVKALGAGGMGNVFLARDTEKNRDVALKILPRDKAKERGMVTRFKSEAQAVANLKHENIVRIFDAGQIDGYLYIALEYLPGTDVHNLVARRGTLPVKRTLEIVKQIASALQHAYERGIVHRDIKPSNLLIARDGTVKLTDMGLARSVHEEVDTGVTRAGTTVGTVDYMAPEQARNSRSADTRSDLYSLGCTWYHMLTGLPPFPEGSLTNKIFAHVSQDRPDPRTLNPSVPEYVVRIMHRLMARQPAERYQTPAELLKELEQPELAGPTDTSATLAELSTSIAREIADEEKKAPPKPVQLPGKYKAGSGKKSDSSDEVNPASKVPWGWLAVIGGGIAAAAGLIWIISGLGGVFDTSGPPKNTGNDPNELASNTQVNAPEVIRVDAGKNPVAIVNENPLIRPVTPETNGKLTRTQKNLQTSLPFGREGERQYLPLWLNETWPGNEGQQALKRLTVGRPAGTAAADFATLAEALANAPAGGAVLQLNGRGPFILPAIDSPCSTLVITGDGTTTPLVTLQNSRTPVEGAMFTLRGGTLILDGLHLALLADELTAAGPLAAFQITNGNLVVNRCTVTLTGDRVGPTIGFRCAQKTDPAASQNCRVLVRDSLFRGGDFTPLELAHSGTDFVSYGSLFTVGDAPALRVNYPVLEKLTAGDGKRFAAFVSSAVSTSGKAIEINHSDQEGLPVLPLELLTINSVLGIPPGAREATLISVVNWPAGGFDRRSLAGFNWTLEGSALVGWADLLHSSKETLDIRSANAWEQFFKQSTDRGQFQIGHWPAEAISRFDQALPAVFNVQAAPISAVKATDGGQPGLVNAAYTIPADTELPLLTARLRRPRVPAARELFPVANQVEVDLKRNDLGRVISDSGWPTGTEFIARGAGTVSCSNIVVQGKSFRIRFEQLSEGGPLTLQPKPVDPTKEHSDAFIEVTGGSVEIVGANVRFPSSKKATLPFWFLQVHDGSFYLKSCFFEGPLLDRNRYKGVIRWTRSDLPAEPAGKPDQVGELEDCYLLSFGSLITANLKQRTLNLKNSVLVALENLADLELLGNHPSQTGAVLLNHCTLSAGNVFFQVKAEFLAPPPRPPLVFYVSETAFAQPAGNGSTTPLQPVLLQHAAASQPLRDFDWWGTANAYSPTIFQYLTAAGAPREQQAFDAGWLNVWKTDRLQRPLNSKAAVLLKGNLPRFTELELTHFALHNTAEARSWGSTGAPVGADLTRIKLPSATATTTPGQEKPKPMGNQPLDF